MTAWRKRANVGPQRACPSRAYFKHVFGTLGIPISAIYPPYLCNGDQAQVALHLLLVAQLLNVVAMAIGHCLHCNALHATYSAFDYRSSAPNQVHSLGWVHEQINLVARKQIFITGQAFFWRGQLPNKTGRGRRIQCSDSAARNLLQTEEDTVNHGSEVAEKQDSVTEFRISDFELCNHVSIGLAGRGDEVVFEAIVRKPESSLNNCRVVLRKLTGPIAQRRGRRALKVLKRLSRRQFMYQLYATEIYGYILPWSADDDGSLTLVHGYHGSYSLHHWLLRSDWLPALEVKLALDEDFSRRVGDDTTGGPAVSRQIRIIRMLLRDLLIGVNYLHCHGLAHTELRLENVHISCVDRHIKVGILGNSSDLYCEDFKDSTHDNEVDRRKRMIAFDVRCVGFMMSKMVLPELMIPSVFRKFKCLLVKENNPSCLREYLLPIIDQKSPTRSIGVQILDRNWGVGWNLLALMLASNPSDRISCLDALRHPFLCGPRWPVEPSVDIIRWGLGSTVVRIVEEYIYGFRQRKRLEHFIDLMERLNPNSELKDWQDLLPGNWRLLYCTGRHIGLTLRQASPAVLIGNATLSFRPTTYGCQKFSMISDIVFSMMMDLDWPHDKTGQKGRLHVHSNAGVSEGKRIYQTESEVLKQNGKEMEKEKRELADSKVAGTRRSYRNGKWRKVSEFLPKPEPQSLPILKLFTSDAEMTLNLSHASKDASLPGKVLREIQVQVPPEMFDVSKLVCGTYIDSRLLILRGVTGSALLFTRTFPGS